MWDNKFKRKDALCYINFVPLNQEAVREDGLMVSRVKCLGTGVGVTGCPCAILLVGGHTEGEEDSEKLRSLGIKAELAGSLDRLRVLLRHRAPACSWQLRPSTVRGVRSRVKQEKDVYVISVSQ